MIRVFLVDDHAFIRRGMRQVLEDAPGLAVVGEAASGGEALRGLQATPCDVVVLDLSLPDRSGLEVLKQMRTERPQLPVLVTTMHREEQYATRALEAGAAGFVTKDTAPEELVTAVRKAARGSRHVTPGIAQRIMGGLGRDPLPHDRLSEREYQVFVRIVAGRALTDIAAEFDLSVKTISTHRARLLEKMDLRTNAELVRYAVRHGLLR